MLGQLEGTLGGVRVVKAATAEHLERRRYRGIMHALVGQHLRLAWLDAVSAPILESLTLIVVGVIVADGDYFSFLARAAKAKALIVGIGDNGRILALQPEAGVSQPNNFGHNTLFLTALILTQFAHAPFKTTR